VAEFFPPTLSFRHALARTALFFGEIGGRTNFIGAPPEFFLSYQNKQNFSI
jgi:hypothetical protein